jgi:hypothetical protein
MLLVAMAEGKAAGGPAAGFGGAAAEGAASDFVGAAAGLSAFCEAGFACAWEAGLAEFPAVFESCAHSLAGIHADASKSSNTKPLMNLRKLFASTSYRIRADTTQLTNQNCRPIPVTPA